MASRRVSVGSYRRAGKMVRGYSARRRTGEAPWTAFKNRNLKVRGTKAGRIAANRAAAAGVGLAPLPRRGYALRQQQRRSA